MDKQCFDELAAKTRLKPPSLRMAEAILVNGLSAAEAVEQENANRRLEKGKLPNITRHVARQAANRILKQMKIIDHYPDDWVTVTTTLPLPWAQLVRYIQTREHLKAGLLVKSEAKLPEFELEHIAEISKMVETILREWRKI
jgi:hypothetical protein